MMHRKAGWMLCVALLTGSLAVYAEEARTTLTIRSPVSRQVFQRNAQDQADLTIRGTVNGRVDAVEAKADLVQGATRGKASDWVVVAKQEEIAGGEFTGKLTLQAGGWYKITVRGKRAGQVIAEAAVDKAGVGDVFITAGQSNSANYGKPPQQAKDDRVVYFNGTAFVPARDPIPGGCGKQGSPWSLLGDRIVQSQGIPVCFRSASLTWTEVKNWMPPNTPLYKNLVQCVKPFGINGVRAVLWHQGESDTLVNTSASAYCERLKTIIETLNRDCGYRIAWFVAQASFHPGSQEAQQKEVAKGQQMLWKEKIAFQGPNTDDLLGVKYRRDGVHFNQAGLDAHAERWFEALKKQYGWKSASPPNETQSQAK